MTPGGRRGLAGALGLIAIGLLGWGLWPTKNVTQTLRVNLSSIAQSDQNAASGVVQRKPGGQLEGTVTLEYPQTVRLGDSVLVRVRLASAGAESERATSIEGADSSGTAAKPAQSVLIQSRLELMGGTVKPEGDITAPWSTDTGVGFAWNIRPSTNASVRGTAWIFVISPGSTAFAGDRTAISAQGVEIASVSLLGVSGPAARATGGIAMILAVILGLPASDRMLAGPTARGGNLPG